MEVYETVRFRVHPRTETKARKLTGQTGACRFAWSHFVGKRRDDYANRGSCNPYRVSKRNKRGPVCRLLPLLASIAFAGTATAEGDPERGKAKTAQCVACHGPDGNSPNPLWPKIAGQSERYIYKQLQMFKRNERVNPLMNPQTAALSEQDMHDLAAYYSSQTASPGATDEKMLELGQAVYRGGNPEEGVPACMSCHGPKGSGNPAALFPRLSHQHAAYVAQRLRNYRDGKETYPGAEVMSGVVKRLTDEEIEAVAAYVQGLH